MKIFSINDGKGFFLTFPNGVRLSTQFGWGHYCENFKSGLSAQEEMAKTNWASNDVEIAIIKNGEFITTEFKNEGDDVLPRQTFEQWLEAFDWCRAYKSKGEGDGK